MNRLIVNALTSVGLVKDGDDPEAKVALFKSATLPTESDTIIPVAEPPSSGPPNVVKETAVDELDPVVEDDTVAPDPFEKAIELEAMLKERNAELVEARETIAKEREARLDREATEKAEALPFVGDAVELAAVFKAADETTASLLHPILEALNQRLSDSDLFKQIGVTTDDDLDPIEQRDRFVKGFVKDNPTATQATARKAFWDSHPQLKEEARKES